MLVLGPPEVVPSYKHVVSFPWVLGMFHGSCEAIIEQLLREEPWKDYQKRKLTLLPWISRRYGREATNKTMYKVQNFSKPLLLYRLTNASN
jgi:hypothetical protein